MSETISIAEYHVQMAQIKKPHSKYGNVRCELDGLKFDSKAERDYFAALRMRELAGEVRSIAVHPFWDVSVNGVEICRVEMDFSFYDIREKRTRIIDVKGCDNPLSKIKRRLLRAVHGYDVEVVQA